MNTTSKHVLQVDDNGSLKSLIRDVKILNKEFDKYQTNTGGARVPKSVVAARAANQREAGQNSGLARSIGSNSGTGAGARDFAKQAEGLGGLVRVYATFAANIFALTAAFGALSKAADTANMTKGLDQLGASSGRNLGYLAKQLVAVTDGAISLREAMTATAQASSGGLSNANILKMGQVAKQASQALGIDMVNAVSRLSRGITKLEPELLDEIGIFVRVDKASQDYARSIGKSALALTDFEKRQAFANAVLTQGAEKFGAIELDANPYSKIQASLENLAFKTLDIVNKVFTPLLNILSANPAALGVAVGAFAYTLLRQAIPAIGQYKQRLGQAAEEARNLLVETDALRKAQRYAKDSQEGIAIGNRVVAAEKSAKAVEAEVVALQQAKSIRQSIAKTLPINLAAVDEAKILDLKKEQARIEKDLAAGGAPAVINRRKLELDIIKKSIDAATELRQATLAADKVDETVSNNRLVRALTYDRARERNAEKAAAKSQRFTILDDISKGMPTRGFVDSFKEMNKQITLATNGLDAAGNAFTHNQKPMSSFNAGITRVIGSAQIVGTAIGTVIGSLGHIGMAVGIVVGSFQLLGLVLSKSAKESAAYDSALESISSSLQSVDRTLDVLNKKKGMDFISAASIQASANAFQGLVDALEELVRSFDKLSKKQNWFDAIGEALLGIVGKDSATKFASNLSDTIAAGIKLASKDVASRDAANKLISEILDTSDVSISNIEAKLTAIAKTDPDKAVDLGNKLAKGLSNLSREANNAASNMSALEANLKETEKLVNDIENSLKPGDVFSKLGADLLSRGPEINKVINGTVVDIKQLYSMSSSPKFLSFLGEETAEKLRNTSAEIKRIADDTGNAQKRMEEALQAEAKAAEVAKKSERFEGADTLTGADIYEASPEAQKLLDEAKKVTAAAAAGLASAKAQASVIAKEFSNVGNEVFKKGIALLSTGMNAAMQEGAITAARAQLGVLKEAGAFTANREAELKQQEINIQKNLINATFEQVSASMFNSVKLAELTAAQQEANALRQADKAGTPQEEKAAQDAIDAAKSAGLAAKEALKLLASKDFKAFSQAGQSGDLAKTQAASMVQSFFVAWSQKQGQLSKLGGQSSAIETDRIAQAAKEQTDAAIKLAKYKNDILDTELASLKLQESILRISNDTIINEETRIALAKLRNTEEARGLDETRRRNKLLEDIAKAPTGSDDKSTKERENRVKALSILDAEIAANRRKDAQERLNIEVAAIDKKYNTEKQRIEELRGYEDRTLAAKTSIENDRISILEHELQISETMGTIDEAALVKQRASLELEKAQNEYKLRSLDIDRKKADVEAEYQNNRAKALQYDKDTPERAAALGAAERTKANKTGAIAAEETASQATLASKLKIIEATKLQGLEQAKLNKQQKEQEESMTRLVSITESLGVVFGDVGVAVGTALQAMEESQNKQQKIQEEVEKARKKFYNDGDGEALIKAEKKAIKDKQVAELEYVSAALGGVKKLFKEKTFAYKAISGIEKAVHIVKMGMLLAENVANIQSVAIAQAASAKKVAIDIFEAGVSGVKAVVNSIASLPFPANIAAGAATAAVVYSLLKEIGGKTPSMPGGASVEQKQTSQGTGQDWVNGKLLDNGGGALGNSKSKNDSLVTGIETMSKNSFETLEYSNKMLDQLQSINRNTEGFAAYLLQSGLNFKHLNPDGTFANTQTLNNQEVLKTARMLGIVRGSTLTGLSDVKWLTKLEASIERAVLGSTKKELLDQGVVASGSISNLRTGTFSDVKTTSSPGLFGRLIGQSGSSHIDREINALTGVAAETFNQAFTDMYSLAIDAVKSLGKDSSLVDQIGNAFQFTFEASLKDLSPEDVEKTLQAELSTEFNKLAKALADEIDTNNLRKPGEEMGEALLRISRDITSTAFVIQSAGLNLRKTGDWIKDLKINQFLINSFNGIDAFIEKTNTFTQNFLTKSQQLLPVQLAVTKRMTELGYAAVDTKKEFATLVQGLDLTKEADVKLFKSLMDVQDGFLLVAEAAEELASKQLDQQVQVLKLTGRGLEATVLQREKELKALEQQDTGVEKTLVATQKYIWALEDQAALSEKTFDQEQQILKLSGASTRALNLQREKEINLLRELDATAEKILVKNQLDIYYLEDLNKIRDAENKILNAMGYSYVAILRTRWEEVKGLEGAERALKEYLFAQEDLAKTQSILSEIMEAEGKTTEALTIRRRQELRGLSATDQSLKIRLWRLQDEKKLLDIANSQQERILNLTNKATEALAMTRRMELETLDEQLRPAQLYIYALEDEATLKDKLRDAYEKESAAAKATVESLRASSKALKEYKLELLTSDKSILTPTQKYAAAKAAALQIAAEANSIAITDEQKKAKEEAISKLPAATDKWLEASRVLFASSDAYTNDFNTVVKILDSTASALDARDTVADKQLTTLDAIKSFLDSIDGRDVTTAEYMLQLKEASVRSAAALDVLNANLTTARNPQAAPVGAELEFGASGKFDESTILKGTAGLRSTIGELRSSIKALSSDSDYYKLYGIATANGISSTMLDAIAGYAPGTALTWALSHGLPAFKNGGLSVGGLVGEEGAEVVDFKTPGRIYSANNTATMIGNTAELINEIRAVRAELAQLRKEQAEQTGHLIGTGLASTNQTVDAIQEAANKAAENASWNNRNTLKIA